MIKNTYAGDKPYTAQFYECKYRGDTCAHPISDPNPLLQLLSTVKEVIDEPEMAGTAGAHWAQSLQIPAPLLLFSDVT
jgi:hypothetical protein